MYKKEESIDFPSRVRCNLLPYYWLKSNKFSSQLLPCDKAPKSNFSIKCTVLSFLPTLFSTSYSNITHHSCTDTRAPPTSLWPTTINKTLSKQRTKVEPEMQLASLGLSFIALFLCDERASIRKLKMYFAFRSPLLLLLPSGEKGMKCNKNETEMRTPHGASGTGEKLQEKRAKYGNGAELRSKWQSHLAHCTLPGNSNTGSSGNYQQFTTILAPPLG